MTTEEENQKIVQSIANATFQSLTLNGLIHAAKFYSIKEAEKKLENLDQETRDKLIEEIDKAGTPSEPPSEVPGNSSQEQPESEDSPEKETA